MKNVVFVLALAGSLIGCGGTSDPIKDYRKVTANDVPTPPGKSVEQNYDQCGDIEVVTSNVVAIEGKTATQKIVLKSNSGKDLSAMSVVSTDDDNVPAKDLRLRLTGKTAEGTEYSLTYTAPKNFIPRDKSDRKFMVTLSATELLRAAKLCPVDVTVTVKRDVSVPSLLTVRFPRTLKLESLSDQTILVDVAAADTVAADLSMVIGYDRSVSSRQKPFHDMSSLIAEDSVAKQLTASRFRFELKVSGEALRTLATQLFEKNKSARKIQLLATLSVKNNKISKSATSGQNMVIDVTREANEAELAAEAAAKAKTDAAAKAAADKKAAADAAAAAVAAASAPKTAAPAATPAPATPAPAATAAPAAATPAPSVTPPKSNTSNPTQAAQAAGAKK